MMNIFVFGVIFLSHIIKKKYFRRSYHQLFFPEIRPLINKTEDHITIEKMKINKQNKETNSNEEYEYGSLSSENSSYINGTFFNCPFFIGPQAHWPIGL